MARPEALAGAVDRGEELDRDVGAVIGLDGVEAAVAVAAGAGVPLAEMVQDRRAPARGRLADAEQRVELGALDALDLLARLPLVDHPPALDDVLHAVGHPGLGRLAVAPRAPRFLVVGLHRAGQIEMGDEAHVRLVDAHAEGGGGAQDEAAGALEEGVLVRRAVLGGHAGMVGERADALLVQEGRGLLHLAPAEAINDAVRPLVAGQEVEELAPGVVALDDLVADVRPVEARLEDRRAFEAQPLDDVRLRRRVGGGRQRDARDLREVVGERGELAVFRPEVVAPGAHAMRLVDGEERYVDPRQRLAEARRRHALGRHVEELEAAVHEVAAHGVALLVGHARVQRRGRDAGLAKRLDLVAHECDQRRDDDGRAAAAERRHLITDRLAFAGGKQDDRVAARHQPLHHRLLLPAKGRVAEDRLQDIPRIAPFEIGDGVPGGGQGVRSGSEHARLLNPMSCGVEQPAGSRPVW